MPKTSQYVFPTGTEAGHIREPRWALDWIEKRTGIHVSVHGLRRTFVTVASACPVSPTNLAQLVGHSPTTITESYAMPDAQALREAARVIGARMEALTLESRRAEGEALLA
jgi:integrase